MKDEDMKVVNGELSFSIRGALKIIFITVIFPDINEIKAYYNCKHKVDKIAELLAVRKYGKSKRDVLREILKIKTKEQLETFVSEIYEKFIFQDDVADLLRSV